ncbi:glycine zipper family protein [Leptolyngbya sp. NK1-12]|uniref:Glycine zipper family protein n=1 Tax=Leptolyngbya sp. NK1-12 TaxID=2547451 RepID=A0AA96WF44_9CYAN|nr:hypothetical protein [Leptolyngbya sp. NK1-12]WNZ24064.1 glycine zipper family protein [Leptolyngbya sp. NK1-12]
MAELEDFEPASANPDPITGEPGAHPVGTGVGAAAVGAAATAIGATAGPIGAVVGAVVGSVIGGLVGKSAAEATNPTIEEAYWREQHQNRTDLHPERSYEAYQLAYQLGYESYVARAEQRTTYQEVEPELEREYERRNDGSSVEWNDAKYAVRDAWERARRNDFFYRADLYWRENYRSQPYSDSGFSYEDYQPAYRTGYEGYVEYAETGESYDEIESELRRSYEENYGTSGLAWEDAKHAVRDGWNWAEQKFQV